MSNSSLPAIRLDVHQHVWTGPLVDALAARGELPFVRFERGLAVMHLAGEHPYVIDLAAEAVARRRRLIELDGLDSALVCLSSPLGIESLPRDQALPLIAAYHEGAHALGDGFGVWGSIALDDPDPGDVDDLLDAGCVGLSLPAGAIASVASLERIAPVLARLQARSAPLFVHAGPPVRDGRRGGEAHALRDPLWWPALTSYVAQMHDAWLAFSSAGRAEHPRLRIVFSMLAGLAPLHFERLRSRGAPVPRLDDPLTFYDTASYGARAVSAVAELVGAEQMLYGSDRPVVEPAELDMPHALEWEAVAAGTRRAFRSALPAAGVESRTPGPSSDRVLLNAR